MNLQDFYASNFTPALVSKKSMLEAYRPRNQNPNS